MMHITIITPKGVYKEIDATAIQLSTLQGQMTILPNHMPIVAMLKTCPCTIWINQEKQTYALAKGIMQFSDNQMQILSDAIEYRQEIDIERAKQAKKRAEQRLNSQDKTIDYQRAKEALQKAENRIKVYEI